MKKIIALVSAALMFMTGCSQKTVDVIENQISEAEKSTEITTETTEETIITEQETVYSTEPVMPGDVDVDITKMSSSMAYAQLYLILTDPEEYMGQTIKMRGELMVIPGEEMGVNYFLANLYDETACCQLGLEFIWSGEHTYPDNYPPEASTVEICGKFSSYQEGEQTYYYVQSNELIAVL